MGVLHSSGRVGLAFLGLLLLLTPFFNLFLILVSLQPRELISYGAATVVAFPVAILFARRECSLKRLWTFVYRVFVLELFFGLLIVGLLLVVLGVFSVANIPLPSLEPSVARLSMFLFGWLLVAPSYWISYEITYTEKRN